MRFATVLAAVISCSLIGSAAIAQGGETPPGSGGGAGRGDRPGGGERQPRAQELSPEKSLAAWRIQASGVATKLALSAEQKEKLLTTYIAAREAMAKAIAEQRAQGGPGGPGGPPGEGRGRGDGAGGPPGGEGAPPGGAGEGEGRGRGEGGRRGDGAERFQANAELLRAEREKLQTALAAFLGEEQVKKAVASLGTFNPTWDLMVDAIARFKLEDAADVQAFEQIEHYVVSVAMARQSDDGQARREAMTEARGDLMDAMEELLSEEQLAEFGRLMRPGRGGGGGGQGAAEMMERLDGNKDGKLDKNEVEGRMLDNFDRIDANKDGFLDVEELRAMAGRRGGRNDN